MAGKMIVNYGNFESWASKFDVKNTELLETLHSIQNLIKSLEGEYESNAAVTIREKIQGMEPRFEQYHTVVDNYVKFVRNAAIEYGVTEDTNNANANQFI